MSTNSPPAGMPTSDHVTVSPGQLRAARHARGWTQQQVADYVQVTRNTIARMERGERVRLSTHATVARALGIGPDHEGAERARLVASLTDTELLAEVAARFARLSRP